MRIMKSSPSLLCVQRVLLLLFISIIHSVKRQPQCMVAVDAFVLQPPPPQYQQLYQKRQCRIEPLYAKVATSKSKVYTTTAVAIVPLFPEPPGGIELQPLTPVDSSSKIGISRLKQLDTVLPLKGGGSSSSTTSAGAQPIYQFWMTTYTENKAIQEVRQTILKDASKKANFPGFRKGQVPPYAQPQITQFAIQECIIKTVERMVVEYGLQSLSGSDGQVQVHEDVSEMTKLYKPGTSIQFTATLNAMYDETKLRQQQQQTDDDDAPTTTTTTETIENVEAITENVAVVNDVVVEEPMIEQAVTDEAMTDKVATTDDDVVGVAVVETAPVVADTTIVTTEKE